LKRVVVDANVLSALVGNPEAAPAMLLEAIHDHAVEMVTCPMLIAEVRDNLTEPYFRALLDQGEAAQAVSALERVAVMLDDPVDPEPVLRDSSDDYRRRMSEFGALRIQRTSKAIPSPPHHAPTGTAKCRCSSLA
jgi:predicted nucleic acid-binding protein